MDSVLKLPDGSSIEITQNEEMGEVVQVGIVLSENVYHALTYDNAMLWEELADVITELPDTGPAQIRDAFMEVTERLHHRGVFVQLDYQNLLSLQNMLQQEREELNRRIT